jgi:iron complex transport system ATP-binding protein
MVQQTPCLLAVQGVALAHAGCAPFVRDISFTLNAGESLVILGPNGSGKTTLLRTILGLMPQAAGSITFAQDAHKTTNSICAYVPQHSATFSGFSAVQVIQMGLMARQPWHAQPGARELASALEALQTLGIIALADADFSTLSGGEQQLVLIARALAMQARIILLDEPAAGLDLANQAALMALCISLKQRGVALILTTHNPQHALTLGVESCDQTLTMSRSGAVMVGATVDVCSSAQLNALYGVEVEVVQVAKRWVVVA